jgi:hypothetical protein
MGGRPVPRRTVVTLRLLQMSCGVLAVTALLALGQTPPPIDVHDGATTVASAHPAVPTEWRNAAGPLAIPTIGVVPPGMEDWFDPSAEPTFRAQDPLPTAVTMPPPRDVPASTTDEPTPTTPPATQPTGTTPTEAPPPETTTPGTTTSETTAPGTTATGHDKDRRDNDRNDRKRRDNVGHTTTGTTTPETSTPQTTSPGTTTPPTTSPATTTPPTTTPAATETPETTTPAPTQEPAPTTPPVQTNARGNVVLGFGEELTVFDGVTGAASFAIAVDGVVTDLTCSEPAVNGHLVAVTVRATTGADLAAVGGAPAIRATDFRFLAEDGVRLTKAATRSADSCLPAAERFPAGPLAAAQELSGVVVLDLPPTAGRLVFTPEFLAVGAEWKYAPPPPAR